jgi:hypothetical protein
MRIAPPKRRLALLMSRRALHGRLVLPAALLALFLSIAPPAGADVGATIISKCTHGESLSGFSQSAYRQALQELPTEVEEYSDCANLIRRAQLAAAGQGASSREPTAPTAIPVTPAERSALNRAPEVGAGPLLVGSTVVRPGVIHANIASAISSLPTPLLAMLAFMLACALLLAGRGIRNRVHAHRAR